MTVWLLRRLAQAVFVVLAMTVIVFLGLHVIGNPVDILISPEADQADRARAIAALGLDAPLWQQYVRFLWRALHGDLGRSFVFNAPALQVIAQRVPATMELAVSAVLLSIVIGIPLGLYAGLHPDGLLGRATMAISIFGISLPTFWVGLVLIMVFAVQLGWLPSTGRGATREFFGVAWSFLTLDGLAHMAISRPARASLHAGPDRQRAKPPPSWHQTAADSGHDPEPAQSANRLRVSDPLHDGR